MNKTRFLRSFPLLVAGALLGGQVAHAVEVDISGSLRPRVEFANEGIQGQGVGQKKSHVTMQTRINVKATVDEDVSAFIQIQDVRTWGGATPTSAPPSITQTGTSLQGQLDLHQAFFTVKNTMGSGVDLKIGRQELVFDEHRLIGNIGWIQQGQTFDAARADSKIGGTGVTAFYAQTTSTDSHPTLTGTLGGPANTFESSFGGLRATWSLGGKDRVTPYAYYALNPTRSGNGAVDPVPDALNILYTGLYVVKHIGGFRLRFDGAYQSGKQNATTTFGAYMLTAAVSKKLDIASGAKVVLWADYLSGDSNGAADGKIKTFTTPYATNHKFYGHMDKFLNIPASGLIDLALKGSLKATPKLKFQLDAHMFRADKTTALVTNKDLGSEIDFDINYALATNTSLRMGYSHFFKGDASALGVAGDPSVDSDWAWMMMTMKF